MRDHTDLLAWQEAQAVALACIRLAKREWQPPLAAVFQQLLKASLSVQLNLAEGYALYAARRTQQFWLVAYGSSVEAVECLEVLRDSGIVTGGDLGLTIERARKTSRLVLGLLRRRTAQSRGGRTT